MERGSDIGMVSDTDPAETPVTNRRVIKLARKNRKPLEQDEDGANAEVAEEHAMKPLAKSPRVKGLNISKILGKLKHPSNYSGFSSNSSFANSTSNNSNANANHWKTESLFKEDDEDNEDARDIESELMEDDSQDIYPELKIGEKQKKLKKQANKRSKQKTVAVAKPVFSNSQTSNRMNSIKATHSINSLDLKNASKSKTAQSYPSSSPERIQAESRIETEPPVLSPSPSPIPEQTHVPVAKKKAATKNITKQTGKRKTPAKKPEISKKRKVEAVPNGGNKTKAKPQAKRPAKKKSDSTFSLFDILDIGNVQNQDTDVDAGFNFHADDGDGADNDDSKDEEIFILESPVKKKSRKRKTVREREIEKEREEAKKVERERKRNEKREEARQRAENERESQRLKQIKQEKKLKKMEMLQKLKESTAEIISKDKRVETIMIPLKDEEPKHANSHNNIKLRRSSLASRGKRLSSIGNGFVALPHDNIPNGELYKHIDIGLPDSHKLKHLLVWISKRLLNEPERWLNEDTFGIGEEDDDIKSKCKSLCDVVLNEFIDDLIYGRIDIDWWGEYNTRDYKGDAASNRPIIVRKNEDNINNGLQLEFYENEIKKLEDELEVWKGLTLRGETEEYHTIYKELENTEAIELAEQDFNRAEVEAVSDLVMAGYKRAEELEKVLHRLQVGNTVLQRVTKHKNQVIAKAIKDSIDCDGVELLANGL